MRHEDYSFREFSSKWLRRKAFIQWRKTVDPRQLFFVDETGFEDFSRHYGRSPSNYPLPSFAPKVKPDKTCVIGVVGFLRFVQAIRFDTNAYRSSSLAPQICFNTQWWLSCSISSWKNITLVKLPTYSYDLNPIEMVFGLAKAYSSLRHKDIDNKAVSFQWYFSRGNPKLYQPLLDDTVLDDIKNQMQT